MKAFLCLLTASLFVVGCASKNDSYYATDQSIPPYTTPDGQVLPPVDPNAQQPSPNVVPVQSSTNNAAYTQRPAGNEPRPWDAATKPANTTTTAKYPVATPIKGKKGQVTSPYAQYAGPVSVEGIAPGTQVKCPYTGKIFIVP